MAAETYMVVRDTTEGQTDRIAIFFAPGGQKDKTHLRRIQKLSPFRFIGMVTSEYPRLDKLTEAGAISDAALLRRTGIDVRALRA